MWKYIVRDMISMLHYVPYAIAAWIAAAVLSACRNRRRRSRGEATRPVCAEAGFYMYVVLLLVITFFSRESGSGKGLDLKLFSTWGINNRNNAYVIENILLFIPYGFVCAWNFTGLRNFFVCTLTGFLTSLGIECLQLITRRGVFQIDDILTNVLGSMIGCIAYWCICRRKQK